MRFDVRTVVPCRASCSSVGRSRWSKCACVMSTRSTSGSRPTPAGFGVILAGPIIFPPTRGPMRSLRTGSMRMVVSPCRSSTPACPSHAAANFVCTASHRSCFGDGGVLLAGWLSERNESATIPGSRSRPNRHAPCALSLAFRIASLLATGDSTNPIRASFRELSFAPAAECRVLSGRHRLEAGPPALGGSCADGVFLTGITFFPRCATLTL